MFSKLTIALLVLAIVGVRSQTLNDGCGEKRTAKIQSIAQARELISGAQSDAGRCKPEQIVAISDLGKLLDGQEVDVCSEQFVGQIRLFHLRYMDSTSASYGHLPIAFKDFFIELAMKLHHHCSKGLLSKLESGSGLLPEEDKQLMQKLFGEEGALKNVLRNYRGIDDLITLSSTMGPDDEYWKSRHVVVGPVSEQVQNIYDACKKSFKPIYEKYITPVTSLAVLGYGYLSKDQMEEFADIKNNEEVQLWYKMTALCDAAILTELWHDPSRTELEPVPADSPLLNEPAEKYALKSTRNQISIPSDGEKSLDDKLFEGDVQGEELEKARKRFRTNKDTIKMVRRAFPAQLTSKVLLKALRHYIKLKVFNSNTEINQLQEVIRKLDEVEETNAVSRKKRWAFDHPLPLGGVFTLVFIPVLGWAYLIMWAIENLIHVIFRPSTASVLAKDT